MSSTDRNRLGACVDGCWICCGSQPLRLEAESPTRTGSSLAAKLQRRHVMWMTIHKYHVGDRVRLIVGALDGDIPDGAYTISRLLPVEGPVCRYRVQHDRDKHERVVREEQMA